MWRRVKREAKFSGKGDKLDEIKKERKKKKI